MIVRKIADEALQNNDTLQNDDHLFFAIGANEEWVIDIVLFIYTSENQNFKGALAIPAGADVQFAQLDYVSTVDALTDPIRSAVWGAEVRAGFHHNTGTHTVVRYVGWVKNGATPGNVQFQWAQFVDNPGWVTLYEGSYLVAREV